MLKLILYINFFFLLSFLFSLAGIFPCLMLIVTVGASSGIGAETARVLALRGVHVIMGVRNMASGSKLKEAIAKDIPTAKIDAMELDLSSMASVRKFASEFNFSGLPLNLLM